MRVFLKTEGTLTLTAAVQKIVSTSTPCAFIWFGPPCSDAGVGSNTEVVRVGVSATAPLRVVHPANLEGVCVPCDDAFDVTVKGKSTETINWQIYTF